MKVRFTLALLAISPSAHGKGTNANPDFPIRDLAKDIDQFLNEAKKVKHPALPGWAFWQRRVKNPGPILHFSCIPLTEPSPMKIGVISDTHLKKPDPMLEKIARQYFRDVELILHAGDLVSLQVLDVFKGKEVIAVAGNNDLPEVKRRLPVKKVISVSDFKIGLAHGWGLPIRVERKVTSLFRGVHCIVFGHSHWAANHHMNGVLYFNPGAFSGGMTSLWQRSIGLLTIDREIHGEIIKV